MARNRSLPTSMEAAMLTNGRGSRATKFCWETKYSNGSSLSRLPLKTTLGGFKKRCVYAALRPTYK